MPDGAQKLAPCDPAGNELLPPGPFFQPTDWLSCGFTSVVVLVGFLHTLAPEVTLGMSGVLTTAANYAGVAGPPGYPIWTLYSWLFIKLIPFSNIAWRVTVGSAVAAAFACGLVALMVSRSGGMLLETARPSVQRLQEEKLVRAFCGIVAGMALGFSHAAWCVAVVVETWAVSVLLFAITLCLLMCWMGRPKRRRFLYATILAFGLLLTNHQELLVMTPTILLLVILCDQELGRDLAVVFSLLAFTDWGLSELGISQWLGSDMLNNSWLLVGFVLIGIAAVIVAIRTRRFGSEWRATGWCLALFLLALGSYFCLPVASMTNPPMNWAYPREFGGFVHGITRGQFPRYRPTEEPGRFVGQLWILARATWKGFGWPYLAFTIVPFGLLGRTERCVRAWLLGLAAALVCTGPFMIALLNPPVDLDSVEFLAPFFGPLYVVLAILTGMGLVVVGSAVARMQPEKPSLASP
jgi:hypothetical protein